jgi:uncharacterized protein YjbI with pentapeptide repeats
MRKISPMISASVSSKILKTVLIASGAAVVFVSLLLVQQNNINSLDLKIRKLSARIVQASSIDERLKLEKDVVGFEKDKTIIQNGAYTNLVQALGGLVLSMTAWVGYQNFRVGEKNLKISEDKQVTERFSKSIEHLGSDKIDIRLGGIYALEQIAIDSAKYHWTIVEILSAFIREKCSLDNVVPPTDSLEKTSLEEQSDYKTSVPTPKKVGVDIKAAMTVLGRRKVTQDPLGKSIDLRTISLPFIELQGANLNGANLNGANLNGANLNGADLNGANLNGANLNGADLNGANLNGASMIIVNLSKADLSKADLSEANLTKASMIAANLTKANLTKASMIAANLSKANLSEASMNEANLYRADLSEADLSEASMNGASMIKASMNGASMIKANLIEVKLIEVNLIGVNLSKANLSKADLYGANLMGANLMGANLSEANLIAANLSKANLSEANLLSTRFGDNLGISDGMKKELKDKGAIFRDSPGS